MRRTSLLLGLAALLLMLPFAWADDGQGTAQPNTRVEGLNLGAYWYGAEIDKADLTGKVVLVEIWGS